MDQLSPGELYELILLGEASIDSQFQLWLTCTFATIVASVAARQAVYQAVAADEPQRGLVPKGSAWIQA